MHHAGQERPVEEGTRRTGEDDVEAELLQGRDLVRIGGRAALLVADQVVPHPDDVLARHFRGVDLELAPHPPGVAADQVVPDAAADAVRREERRDALEMLEVELHLVALRADGTLRKAIGLVRPEMEPLHLRTEEVEVFGEELLLELERLRLRHAVAVRLLRILPKRDIRLLGEDVLAVAERLHQRNRFQSKAISLRENRPEALRVPGGDRVAERLLGRDGLGRKFLLLRRLGPRGRLAPRGRRGLHGGFRRRLRRGLRLGERAKGRDHHARRQQNQCSIHHACLRKKWNAASISQDGSAFQG